MHTEQGAAPTASSEQIAERLRAGDLEGARREAREALAAGGPDSALYLLLARAHREEDDDDHDDLAAAVYYEGLAALPEDLDLLAAYAEHCLESDADRRPGRYRHGFELADRLASSAPESAQARRIAELAAGKLGTAPKPPSAARIQRHDARLALAAPPDEADLLSRRDERRAVRAETLAALARPGGRLLRPLVRAPLSTGLALAAGLGLAVLAVPAFRWPGWSLALLVPPFVLPLVLLRRLLAGARRRGRVGPGTPGAAAPDAPKLPPLPAVPPYSAREKVVPALAALVLAGSVTGAVVWSGAQYRDYPRYEASAPLTFRQWERLYYSDGNAYADGLAAAWARDGLQTFGFAYGSEATNTAKLAVAGAVGDLHGLPADVLGTYEQGLASASARIHVIWATDPGPYGGSMRCISFTSESEEDLVGCSWVDGGSIGLVVVEANGLTPDAAAELARATRGLVLHRTDRG
ncbi:hypothetical protein ACFVHB_27525 [Kitasatospora sp. NPDC127111]|uniref:hypothetical protein n=1 Tax=Kitasatospora sp. NPDC127111 TaxID=3345363 RepID=UPI0036279FEB